MKRRFLLVIAGVLIMAIGAGAAALIDDRFADGNSQNQDLANNSLRLFNGRANTVRTDAVGSVAFDITNAGGSEAFWAFFTNAGSPVTLGVGDRFAVALTFSLAGFQGTGQDVRFGVLNSLGTRNANNLTGGMNDSTFVNDTGYGLQFFASGTGNPFVIARRTTLTSANVFNSFADFPAITTGAAGATARQPLVNDTLYTLTYAIERRTATETRIEAAVTGGGLSGLNYSVVEASESPNTSFDYFAFRIGGPNFATKLTFTRLLVDYAPAPPVITSQPQPSNLTVQVGSKVTLAIAANGNALIYQWQKNGAAISGNPSSSTPTLNLINVQLSDAGSYTAVVSNAGGIVRSNPATLNVTTDPVPPPPNITKQPADTTVTLGGATSLSVTATGNALVYQWFKNSAIIPGATNATLSFSNAQVSDSANYTVVVSNSSGSLTSVPAALLVVSPMAVRGFIPANDASRVCIDTPLYLTFDQAPRVGKTGRLRVYRANDTLVDTIDMSLGTQSKTIGTASAGFNYYPILVTGNTAAIYLHKALEYGQSYYITLEPGVITDAGNAPFDGISSRNTWRFSTKPIGPPPGARALTVAGDNSGDFCTVQGAIDFVPVGNTERTFITVHRGVYNEIVYVGSNKPFITVRGENRDQSVIEYANNAGLNPAGTVYRTMFGVDAADFVLENITLRNTTPKGGSQAEAFRGNNQRILLNRVNLKSFQDTLMLQGRAFVNDSYIEGDVDFMWGSGAVFFQNCELRAVSPGYYTQIRNPQNGNGNVYVNCRLTGASGVTGVYLSRIDPNVYPFSQAVFINCAMGPHILPAGWLLNNATSAPNVQFWEAGSTDPSGAPLDTSQRASFSRQLNATETAQWSNPAFVLGGWAPITLTASPDVDITDAAITVNWLAPSGNRATDWIGFYREGDADSNFIARLNTSASINNNLIIKPPAFAGRYEFRYFRGNSSTRAATSNIVTLLSAPLRRNDGPLGFAAVNALGQNGTMGGAGGQTITVTTAAEFLNYIARPEPFIIRVAGMLALPGPMHNVASNKTIIGVGSNSGFTGGGLNIGPGANDNITEPPPNTVKNIIIRNLIFTNLPDDAINIQMFSHHIWIDHCDLSNGFDGLIDIKRGSDYVTVSWNRLHNHSKTSLVGHDDNNGAQDIGRLKVTYHHNWFDGTAQRNPRVRFGEPVHVFNNFYLNNVDVGAACFVNSGCIIEGNYFENLRNPITINNDGPPGRAVERLNLFVRSGAPVVGGSVTEPRTFYGYVMDDAANVRTLVTQGAGVGKEAFLYRAKRVAVARQ